MSSATLLGFVLLLFVFGCSPKNEPDHLQVVRNLLPEIPASSSFGPFYPHLTELLTQESPNVVSALRDTHAWALAHLPEFKDGACATVHVLADDQFARLWDRTTLGITLPWMEIEIRDGAHSESTFKWRDASLFVSTVLHEYVHAAQRARQARVCFGTSECESSHAALSSRQVNWLTGFQQLEKFFFLGPQFSTAEKRLLYYWVSPFMRARDEVEAAAQTVKWMHENPNELNAFTLGGANNWLYAIQFLEQLKKLASTDCFSQDDETYDDEKKIYETEIPVFIRELRGLDDQIEKGMHAFFDQHELHISPIPFQEYLVVPNPRGRLGRNCATGMDFLQHAEF